jgi:4-amino-4-deoxy-L-arabinose transferase-like glycosyltransferase
MGARAHLALLVSSCALLFFLGLGTLGLTDRDEGSNAEAAREMVESGDWITPTLNGVPRFAKPILLYWLISGTYLAFGVSEFTARLPSAAFGTALIVMQYLFARRILGPAAGLRAALMLLLSFEILGIARMVLTDMVLVFFTTLSIFSFFLAMWGEGTAKRWYWGFYLGMALATLTKGPVGVVVPLLAIVPYLLLTRRWRDVLRECRPLTGTLVFFLVAAPWYATMLLLHGAEYVASGRRDTITRFFSVVGFHGGTVLFYVPVLLLGFFPWSGFLPAALVQALRGSRKAAIQDPSRALAVLSGVWVLGVFTFFTLSSTRLPHYIAPMFPAAALLVAASWDRLLSGPAERAARLSLWLTLGTGCLLGLAFVGLDWAYDHFNAQIVLEFPVAGQVGLGWAPVAVGFLLLGGTGLFAYAAIPAGGGPADAPPALTPGGHAGRSLAIASAMMAGVALLIITVALPRFHRYFIGPPQELAAIAGMNLGAQDTLIAYGGSQPSLIFSAKRRCEPARRCIEVISPGEEEKMRPLLDRPGQVMILTQERLRAKLPPPAATYPVALSRYGYVLLAKNPTF